MTAIPILIQNLSCTPFRAVPSLLRRGSLVSSKCSACSTPGRGTATTSANAVHKCGHDLRRNVCHCLYRRNLSCCLNNLIKQFFTRFFGEQSDHNSEPVQTGGTSTPCTLVNLGRLLPNVCSALPTSHVRFHITMIIALLLRTPPFM